MKSKQLHGVYAITDPQLCEDTLLVSVEEAIKGGIALLQYRNKAAACQQQLEEAAALKTLCQQHNVLFLINDNIELALRVDADGVHLGQQDTALLKARQSLGENKIIGISCNNRPELALAAQRNGADYLALGRFFTSQTKPLAPQADADLLAQVRNQVSIPIVAIGGITPTNGATLIAQGADMLAAIHGIFAQTDIRSAAKAYVRLFATETSRM